MWPRAADGEECAGEAVRAQTTEGHKPAWGSGAQHPLQVLAAVGKPGAGKSHTRRGAGQGPERRLGPAQGPHNDQGPPRVASAPQSVPGP